MGYPLAYGLTIGPRFLGFQFSIKDLVADIIQNNCWLIPNHIPVELKAFLYQSTSQILIGGNEVPDIVLARRLHWYSLP